MRKAATGGGIGSGVSAAAGARDVAGSLDWLIRNPEPNAVTIDESPAGPIEAAEARAQDSWLVALHLAADARRAEAAAASRTVIDLLTDGVKDVEGRLIHQS